MDIPTNRYLGQLCKWGHNWDNTGKSLRYSSGGLIGRCIQCARERAKKWGEKNKDKKNQYWKEWYKKNLEKVSQMSKQYYQKNKEKKRIYCRNKNRIRYKTDIKFRLNNSMSSLIRYSLKGNKKGIHWESLLDYTIYDLKQHLEKQFKKGMNWDNYGKWHIDHIIPINAFNFTSPEHLDFKRCWELNNLQPLWAKENLSKHNKLERDFQPSFEIEIQKYDQSMF